MSGARADWSFHKARKLEQYLIALMDEHDSRDLSPRIRILVADMCTQWRELDRRIAAFDAEFVSWARENQDARRLADRRDRQGLCTRS